MWDNWSGWCHKRQIDLLQASVIQVVEFLTDCYHGGKEYSTINTYRSARTVTTVMLCVLASAQRQQTLSALDLKFRKESRDSFSFVLTDRLKISRPGKSTEITFSSSGCASICPFAALKEYISRSETLRTRSGQFVSKLFLSFIRPYNPVSPRTIARWIMSVLQSAEIDTSV